MMSQSSKKRVQITDHAHPVAENVRAKLNAAGMSGRALAAHLGVTQMYAARRLSGEVDFSATDLTRIAAVLECQVADFFPTIDTAALAAGCDTGSDDA